MITSKQLIASIPALQNKIINFSKNNNQLIRYLDHESLKDAYWTGVSGMLLDPSKSSVETKKDLIATLSRLTTSSALKELHQRRNDYFIYTGYSGSDMSRQERILFPQEFIRTLPHQQGLLAKLYNQRMYRDEMEKILGVAVDGSLREVHIKFRKWKDIKEYKLSEEDTAYLKSSRFDPRCVRVLEMSLNGIAGYLISSELGMSLKAITALRNRCLNKLPHLKQQMSIWRKPKKGELNE